MKKGFKKVFFVLAPSYHGATLLAKVVNAHPNIISLGDGYPSNLYDETCGCRSLVSECEYWQQVKEAVGADDFLNERRMLPNYPQLVGGKVDKLIYNFAHQKLIKLLIDKNGKAEDFCEQFSRFTHIIHQLEGVDENAIFIDGGKSISRVIALWASGYQIDGVIHLVREAGDFVKSSQKQPTGDGFLMSALHWQLYHSRASKLKKIIPYHAVHYGDLSTKPDEVITGLFDFLGVANVPVDKLVGNMDSVWHFMGNSSLFKFNGTFHKSTYPLSSFEKKLVRAICAFE